jgi:predicted transcriptional regulator of viral defense system
MSEKIYKEDLTRLDQLVRLQERNADLAKELLRCVASLKYIAGIAERGTGRKQKDDETVEQFILDYIKFLESIRPYAPRYPGFPTESDLKKALKGE